MENRLKVEAIIFKPNGRPLCGRTNRVTGMEDALKTSERLKQWAMRKVRVLEKESKISYNYQTLISL